MADNAKTVNIGFGAGFTEEVYTRTGSLCDYRYIDGLNQHSGSIDPIFGPGCRIDAGEYGCYAAPTGHAGPEGSVIYDYVTLKPGMDTYVYLDVGFWGRSDKRSFGVVCGPHVWLCNYGQGGGAPERGDGYANILFNFHREMGNFRVVQQATLPFDKAGDWGAGTARIYLILPDMHMWPNPEELKKRRKEFFTEDELKALDRGVNNGKVIRNSAGSLDVPVKQDETP